MKKVNTFLVGAPKCGTTALSEYLNSHPDFSLGKMKESFFWASEFDGIRRINSLVEYESLFKANKNCSCLCDASTAYGWSCDAIKNILSYNSDAKFIVMFRNPVDLVHAYHMELCLHFQEDELDFEKAWRRSEFEVGSPPRPTATRKPTLTQYRRVGSVGSQLSDLLSKLDPSRLKVILLDEFKSNSLKVYCETLAFLGLRYDGRVEFPVVNASRTLSHPKMAKLLKCTFLPNELSVALRSILRATKLNVARDRFLSRLAIPAERKPLSNDFRAYLENEFASEVDKLSGLLQKDLSSWSIR